MSQSAEAAKTERETSKEGGKEAPPEQVDRPSAEEMSGMRQESESINKELAALDALNDALEREAKGEKDVKFDASEHDVAVAKMVGKEGMQTVSEYYKMQGLKLEQRLAEEELRQEEEKAGMDAEKARKEIEELQAFIEDQVAVRDAANQIKDGKMEPAGAADARTMEAVKALIEKGDDAEAIIAAASEAENEAKADIEKLKPLLEKADRAGDLSKKLEQTKAAWLQAQEDYDKKREKQVRSYLDGLGAGGSERSAGGGGAGSGGAKGEKKDEGGSLLGDLKVATKQGVVDFFKGFDKLV